MISLPPAAIEALLDLACEIQQISSPTFAEASRAEFTRRRMESMGLFDVQADLAGNVLGRLPGKTSARMLVISAHMDTVFPAEFPLTLDRQPDRISGPGIGDNALGLAGLLSLAPLLRENGVTLPGDLWLAATVCEEGLGNLRGIGAVAERFGPRPLAYISLEGMGLGNILHRGLGVERFRVCVHTSGGHSWVDFGSPSAVHELAGLATKLAALRLPRRPRTTLNIGLISGGTSINTIASSAMLELDLRSESKKSLAELAEKVHLAVEQARKPGVEVLIERVGWRPAGEIAPNHPLVALLVKVLCGVGLQPHLDIGSTEANLPLSLGYPSVTIGLTTGDRAHSAQEFIHTAPLEKGLQQTIQLLQQVWDALS